MPPALSSSIEPKAKRTHARRSCGICKLRKSRCELPDLNVPSGPGPLPDDKACHRCRVLSLPCVVDDSNKKQRKRKDDSVASAGTSQPSLAGPSSSSLRRHNSGDLPIRTLSSQLGIPVQNTVHTVDHTLEIVDGAFMMQGPFTLADPVDNYEQLRRELNARGVDKDAGTTKSIKLHGRPLELTCAMLRVAYGRKDRQGKRVKMEDDEVEVGMLVDGTMIARLEPGVAQLRTYHPHLDDLPTLFAEMRRNSEPTISLLIATVAYLASAVLPPDQTISDLRNGLTPYIYQRRDALLLHHPITFFALQFLELFISHCPFGILPLQPTNLQHLGVAKGLTSAAEDISKQLAFDKLVKQLLSGPGVRTYFLCSDLWLWLSLIAAEAAAMLEETSPQKPPQLTEARRITESFFQLTDEGTSLWQDSLGSEVMPILIGKLCLCDKIARLEEVLDGMERIRGVLELSASDPSVDPVNGIVTEFEKYSKRTDDIDKRHDMMMGMLCTFSRNIEMGWTAYRAIRRRYEFSKIHVTGLRALIATHYLPGSPYAYPDLPRPLSPAHAVAYAIARACNPPDIVRFLSGSGNATSAVQAVLEWGRRRGVNLEHNLTACAELAHTISSDLHGLVYSCIVPLHETICIAVESAKILMEMEAGTIHILRSSKQPLKALRSQSWVRAMRQVGQTMHNVSLLFHDDGFGGETVASGASNLIGSMVRTAEGWARGLEEERSKQDCDLSPDMMQEVSAAAIAQQRQEYAPPSGSGTPHSYGQSGGVTSHQQYMDTSDRWMAGSDSNPSMSRSQSQPTPPNNVPTPPIPSSTPLSFLHPSEQRPTTKTLHPTPLDALLSEMFGYSAGPAGQNRTPRMHPQAI